jgi:hypothetical protein
MKYIIILITLFFGIALKAQCEFKAMTQNYLNRDSSYAMYPAVAIDKNGVPFMVSCDSHDSLRVTVKKFNGGVWNLVGNSGFSRRPAKQTSIALDTNGMPYVAYIDMITDSAQVMMYNGSSWVYVGGFGALGKSYRMSPMAIDKNNIPYVAFGEMVAPNYDLKIMKFTGSWVQVGSPSVLNYNSVYRLLSLTLDNSGTPYIHDSYGGGVQKYNGASWVVLPGTLPASSLSITGRSITVDKDDTIHLAYSNSFGKIEIMKYMGTNWVSESYNSFNWPGPGIDASIATDTLGTPYVLYVNDGKLNIAYIPPAPGMGRVARTLDYNPGSAYSSIASGKDGSVYIVFSCVENNKKGTLFKFDLVANGLYPVGIEAFSKETVVTTDRNSTPYMAYIDNLAGNGITVLKHDGTDWHGLGYPGLNYSKGSSLAMIVDILDYPYVAVCDSTHSGKATVYQFDGLGWAPLGQPGFSYGVASYVSMAFNRFSQPNGIFVSFSDLGAAKQAVVMAYNNGFPGWNLVGNATVSAGASRYNKMVTDKTGKPWVVYQDMANGSKATVKKFNGSSWQTVGSPGFSPGMASYTSLVLDTMDVPYVVFKDHANGSKATVMKFNGTSWTNMGPLGFSSDSVNYTDISINAYGDIHVSYSDEGNGGKATLFKFDGTSWVTQPNYVFPNMRSKNVSIVSDKTGRTYVGFDNLEPFVYKLSSSGVTYDSCVSCLGSSFSLNAGGGNTYSWTGPDNFSSSLANPSIPNSTLLNSGIYSVSISTGSCVVNKTVDVTINAGCQDVWPGDANSDGVADNSDILELGLHYTQTGPPRTLVSDMWMSFYATSWPGTISNGKNLTHSDCNGDGIIDDNDTTAIYYNYGLTHTFKPNDQTVINPQLSIVPDQSAVVKGSWGSASVYLGDAANPVSNINGIAFTVNFDYTLIEPEFFWIEYPNSFINASNQNLNFRKLDFWTNNLYTATTHTISNNVSGSGLIAVLHYQINSNLATDEVFNLGITQAKQSDASGNIVPLTSGTATLMAMGSSVGINESSNSNLISISPNPAQSIVSISSTSELEKVEVINVTGQALILEQTNSKTHHLNVEELANGVYFVKVYSASGQMLLKKLVIQK